MGWSVAGRVALEQSVVPLALPRIGSELRTASGVEWLVSAYLLALSVSQPTTGRVADPFGRQARLPREPVRVHDRCRARRGPADLPQLVGAWIVQGIGASGIFPVGVAMIYEHVPASRRGTAIGMFSLGRATARAIAVRLRARSDTERRRRHELAATTPGGLAGEEGFEPSIP